MDDCQETIQTIDQWLYDYEALFVDGMTTISRSEAERRYYERYGYELKRQRNDEG